MRSVEQPDLSSEPGDRSVRDLLRDCGRTRDRFERAALLSRLSAELDQVAEAITVRAHAQERGAETVAGLRGQASMARFIAGLERVDHLVPDHAVLSR